MNIKSTLLFIAAAIGFQANAQTWVTDSVEMGASYANDVYYSVRTKTDYPKPSANWDLGFQMTQFTEPGGQLNASVRANHIKSDVQVYSLHKVASTNFGNLTPSDTMVTLSDQLVNNDTSWGTGAFYQNRSSSPVDFGWGMYAGSPSHNVVGDSLYLVKANGVFYQVWIQEYTSFPVNSPQIGYKFRYAKWDGTGDKTDSVKRVAPYSDRINVFYDLATGTIVDNEPPRADWDILFKQYQKDGQPGGQNPNKLQAYTGVLSNVRVEVAKVTGVDPNSINVGNYGSYPMSTKTNAIGDDWKVFNGSTFMYELDTNTSFIIKPDTSYHAEAYYHLQFTRFDGGFPPNTGKVVFRQKTLEVVSVNDVEGQKAANYSVYPNPAHTEMNIMIDAASADNNTVLMVTDITGKVMQYSNVDIKKGVNGLSIDVSAYAAGTYIVNIKNANWTISDRVVVQH